ncbi:MAG TPA: phosphoribosylformylglycinamidine cyclo-ligase [Polyangiales bacterium]|nr:phosphoribosylformylglycinamidine cyclo-ligase [Polyangiales bacterium]
MAGLTYRDAGVDIEAGDELVRRIKPLARSTHSEHVLGAIGGFAGLCSIPSDIEDPVLVSGTDGVGTKLKLAFELERHDTIGIDLVAMCVNDIITVGARPLFFLDYFATSKLDVDRAEAVLEGIAEGCRRARCALLGGETAELPGFYAAGEYDLAGFAVGVVSRKRIIDGSAVRPGDRLVGIASSGLHSNGFSLARRVLFGGEPAGSVHDRFNDRETLGEALLRPTKIYVEAAEIALKHDVHAMCHITGGGLPENLPRVTPKGLGISIDSDSWSPDPLFDLIRRRGNVADSEMRRTFNMGVGFVMVVSPERSDRLVQALDAIGEHAFVMGEITEHEGVSFSA